MNDSVGAGQRASSTKVAVRSMEAAHTCTHTPLLPPLFFSHIKLPVFLCLGSSRCLHVLARGCLIAFARVPGTETLPHATMMVGVSALYFIVGVRSFVGLLLTHSTRLIAAPSTSSYLASCPRCNTRPFSTQQHDTQILYCTSRLVIANQIASLSLPVLPGHIYPTKTAYMYVCRKVQCNFATWQSLSAVDPYRSPTLPQTSTC